MDREVKAELYKILELIHCSEAFGFHNSILLFTLAKFTGHVTDEEIAGYAASLVSEPIYEESDGEEAIEILTEWRDRYAKE